MAIGVVAMMMLVAGCGGLVGDDGDTEPEIDEEIPEDGAHPDSAVDETTVDTHKEALEDAGSFEATQSVETAVDGEVSEQMSFETTFAIDMVNNQSLQSESSPEMTIERYTEGDTTYQMLDRGGQTEVDSASAPYGDEMGAIQPVNTENAMGGDLVSLDNANYQETGTETIDGVEVTVYESDTDAAADALQEQMDQDPNSNAEITGFTATVKIDSDGVIRYQEMVLSVTQNGEDIEQTVSHEVTAVGDTVVDEPEWVADMDSDDESDSEDESDDDEDDEDTDDSENGETDDGDETDE